MTELIKGRVVKGMGKGSYFTSLFWFCDQVKTNFGFRPFPGTLNLELAPEEAAKVENYLGIGVEIVPDDPNFCGATGYPVLIAGVVWGILVRPLATSHPADVVELVAPVSIRESLGVVDGDLLTISWDDGPKPWRLQQEEMLADYNILQVYRHQATSPRLNKDFDFYALHSNDWVQIVPVTAKEEILMVRQFRHGTGELTLELPGGIIEQELSPEEAAQKELAEEVGYISQKLTYLGKARPNPAILTNWCYFFLAEDLVAAQKPQDDGEDVYLLPVAINKIPRLIKAGLINHSLAIAGFYQFGAR